MTCQIEALLDRMRKVLPPVLSLPDFDKNPALPASKTIRNMRSARTIPDEIFIRDGRRVLVDMASFLDWWGPRLTEDHR